MHHFLWLLGVLDEWMCSSGWRTVTSSKVHTHYQSGEQGGQTQVCVDADSICFVLASLPSSTFLLNYQLF
jgi:hypothetical protein